MQFLAGSRGRQDARCSARSLCDLSPKTLRPPYAYSYSSNIRASAINAQLRRPHPCPRLLHLSLWLINPAPPPYRPGSIRARRAQQFIAQVDLEKIVEHDPAEFEKLGKVPRAMESICAEEDKPAATLPDMTDPIEEAPTLGSHPTHPGAAGFRRMRGPGTQPA